MATRKRGVVKFFNTTNGYGFIVLDDGGKDVFVHQSDLARSKLKTIEQGDTITFDVVETQKGLKATNIDIDPPA